MYDVKLTTITPVHIGDGTTLHNKFDFVENRQSTSRLNEDTIMEKYSSRLVPGRDGSYPAPGALLSADDMNDARLFRYTIPGAPRSLKGYSELKSCIKDVYDRPYIPGSSLKGSIRTALAWAGFQEEHLSAGSIDLGKPKAWTGQGLEKELFGRDSNHSLMRALQVSDLAIGAGNDRPGGGLRVYNVQVITHKSQSSPVELEGIKPEVELAGTIKIDGSLLPPPTDTSAYAMKVRRELGFEKHTVWLGSICEIATRNSKERISRLVKWFSTVEGGERLTRFYSGLAKVEVGKNVALLQLGWGTGWDGMTFGALLQKDPAFFEQIVQRYKMAMRSKTGLPRRAGDAFPKSRRVIVNETGYFAPLGWVMVEFKERKS
jgi:CRISPR-associated protein Csm5